MTNNNKKEQEQASETETKVSESAQKQQKTETKVSESSKAKPLSAKDESLSTAQKQQKTKITKDMLIGEVAQKHPESAGILFKAGMHCIGCGVAGMETSEQGCKAHGMNNKQIDKLIKKMHNNIKEK